ncbi:hypothetical protein F0562_005561 [Nyssa sinensis]|uniref:Pentatricopeptide repeat-containing protein n=1 Tax=Nyssa sinensis TaxID=561372 RepID=A0A5J5AIC6_9ASTE|nr:hypothetical protein F0562_005561 [Nyssa sinensis]
MGHTKSRYYDLIGYPGWWDPAKAPTKRHSTRSSTASAAIVQAERPISNPTTLHISSGSPKHQLSPLDGSTSHHESSSVTKSTVSNEPPLRILPNRTTRGVPRVSYEPVLNSTFKYPLNNYVSYHRIGALSRAGNIGDARQLFDKMLKRDVVSWNAIVTGYWQNGHLEEAKRLFQSMTGRNVVSWNSMIAGCVENDKIDEAFQYFRMMPQRNTASWNAMISGFVRYRRIEEASRLFEEMPRRNVISYTAMIDGYTMNGEIERARALFDCMPCKNAVSWTVMISGYVENGRFEEARELFDLMPDKNVVAMTAMITGYCKEGKMENARILFEDIQCKDHVSFNAMISGYAQNGSGEEALRLHVEMLRRGMQPDNSTLVSVLTACSSLASLKEGRQTHILILKNGFDSHVSVCNALIAMYSKCGGIMESELAFGHIDTPDLVSWNTIIAASAQHGLYEKAVGFFNQMGYNGFEPDGITFLSLLSACGHTRMVDESMYWFDSMIRNYRIIPRCEHYACLVDILSRAGQIEKAYKLIQEMPFEADLGVWGALLAGCQVCLNVELGQLAAEKIMELDPKNSGAYVMLSNIYAAAGMWREVTRVRGLMKEQGVKKQPAYSWTEIGDKVHYFLGGDISHPDIEAIRSELKHINLQMKAMDEIAEIIAEIDKPKSHRIQHVASQIKIWAFRNMRLFFPGQSLLQIDTNPVKTLDQKPLKVSNLSENRIVRDSKMQQHMGEFEGELERTRERLGAAVEERDRVFDELREMKLVAQEANLRPSEALSSRKMGEIVTELNTAREPLSNSKQELKIKERNIEYLNLELGKAKQFELNLAERDALLYRLKEELSNVKASETRAIGLLSESKKRIQELEAEIERGKLSDTKMYDTVVSQTKQLEHTNIELQESKLEIASLREKMEKLEISSGQSGTHVNGSYNYENVDTMKEAFENLKSELQLAEENLAHTQDGEKAASSKVKSLLEEMNLLKNELKLAIEAEEKSKKAMDDLALALKEVATEANQTKEKLSSTKVELEYVKGESEQLKVMVRSTEDTYQKLLHEAKKETERYKNTVERLRLEAEESLLAWNDKEMGFVSCIRSAEEQRTLAQQENIRLLESLKVTESMTMTSREENHKLRDILKQALNEANVAKEAAGIARAENSQLKDCLSGKDKALDFLNRENERLRINEAASHEIIMELKRFLSPALIKELKTEDKEGVMLKLNQMIEEHEEAKKMNKAFSFDLHEILNEQEDEDEEILNEDPEKAEALKGSIFDNVDSPKSEPRTPKIALHHRRMSSFTDDGETTNSEDLDHLDDAENDRNSHRKRRALLQRFGDLLSRSFHKREPSIG